MVAIPSVVATGWSIVPSSSYRHGAHALIHHRLEALVRRVIAWSSWPSWSSWSPWSSLSSSYLVVSSVVSLKDISWECSPNTTPRVVRTKAPSIIVFLVDGKVVADTNLNLIRHLRNVRRYSIEGSQRFSRRHWQALLGRCTRFRELRVRVVIVELSCLLKECFGEILLSTVTAESEST